MARGEWGGALYRGDKTYNIVGLRKRWYMVTGALVGLSFLALLVNGLNLGIEFKGGAVFELPSNGRTVADAREAVEPLVDREPIVTQNSQGVIRIQTEPLVTVPGDDQVAEVQTALSEAFDVPTSQISPQQVGPTWGEQVTNKAITSLVVFLALVVAFMSIRFEFKMAIAALAALAHDVVLTVGVYALLNFEVTPATVIGLLTILGYSLYDTVVVFDKVRENTAGIQGGNRTTYSGAANLALMQTLVRSINTSVIALLPVAGILFIGAFVLGAGTLKDLALALFVGLAAGTWSSIFIATPLLAHMKEREPQNKLLARRVEARLAAGKPATDASAGRTRTAAAPARASTTTALLDRDEDVVDEDTAAVSEPPPAAPAAARPTGGAAARPVRPGPRQQPRKKKPRGGRPKGRKRR